MSFDDLFNDPALRLQRQSGRQTVRCPPRSATSMRNAVDWGGSFVPGNGGDQFSSGTEQMQSKATDHNRYNYRHNNYKQYDAALLRLYKKGGMGAN